jgi:hypothetical protein
LIAQVKGPVNYPALLAGTEAACSRVVTPFVPDFANRSANTALLTNHRQATAFKEFETTDTRLAKRHACCKDLTVTKANHYPGAVDRRLGDGCAGEEGDCEQDQQKPQ